MHTETNHLRPLIYLHKFRTNYNFCVFGLSKQKDHIAGQPIRLDFKFSAAINVADYIAYALVLIFSSEGQRHFDLI